MKGQMNTFIQRLLAQNNDTGLPGIVQPRPLARFEGSDGAAWIEESVEQSPLQVEQPAQLQGFNRSSLTMEVPDLPDLAAAGRQQPRGIEIISDESHTTVQPRAFEITEESEPLSTVIERQTYPDISDFAPQPEAEPAIVQVTRVERVDQELAPLQPEIRLFEIADGQPTIMPAPEPETLRQIPDKTPVVRVSIGRVDVHAAAPAPARPVAPRRAPASPKAVRSLDDYLRNRNEGRR